MCHGRRDMRDANFVVCKFDDLTQTVVRWCHELSGNKTAYGDGRDGYHSAHLFIAPGLPH